MIFFWIFLILFLAGWLLSFREKAERNTWIAHRLGGLAIVFFILFAIWVLLTKVLFK